MAQPSHVDRTVRNITIAIPLLFLVAGCGGPPVARTTFLRSVDLIAMTDTMSMSLAGEDALAGRTSAVEAAGDWLVIGGRGLVSPTRPGLHTNESAGKLSVTPVARACKRPP